jgi:hypothetical protein
MAKLMTLHPISSNQFGLIASDSSDDLLALSSDNTVEDFAVFHPLNTVLVPS